MRATPLPLRGYRAFLLAGLCASALVVGACSGGDKAVVEEITVDAASLDLAPADARALSRHFMVENRGGTDADTLALLDGLSLGGAADNRTIDGSTVTYRDWSATQDDATVTADQVVLRGVHATDDGRTTFDAAEITGMRAVDYLVDETGEKTESVDATLAKLVIVGPSPDLAEDVVELLRGVDGDKTDQLGELSQELDFRGLHLDEFNADVSERGRTGTLSVSQVVVGNDDGAETVDLIVESVDFAWRADPVEGEDTPEPFTLAMDGMTAIGVDTSEGSGPGTGGFMAMLASAAPRAKMPYQQVDIGALQMASRAVDLDFEGFEADSEQDGNMLTLRSVLSPMLVTIKDVSGTPLAGQLEALRENGLDELTIKGSQTSTFDRKADRMEVSEAKVEIDGGLRADCDYALSGLAAAARFMDESGVAMPDSSSIETEEDIDTFLTQMGAYQEMQAEANQRVLIEGLDCTVQDVADNSLVTRGYAAASSVTGKPVLVLKGTAKTAIAMGSMMAPSEFQRDLMDTLGTGFIRFIDKPGQVMRIQAAPETPVAITTLSGPDASIKPLGLSVSVE